MKDLRPEDEVELIEMTVPIGSVPHNMELIVESAEEAGSANEEEAPPPSAFIFERWDD